MISPHDLPPRRTAFLSNEDLARRRADLQRSDRIAELLLALIAFAIVLGGLAVIGCVAR